MLEHLPEALGHALHDVRAGLDQIAFNTIGMRQGMAAIDLASLAFADHAPIPARYTADGEGISPPLVWTNVPDGGSLVLVVEDADSPTPHPLVHGLVVGLPGGEGALVEGAMSDGAAAALADEPALRIGLNSALGASWLPPDPPPGHGTHRYAFQLFALDSSPEFSDKPGRDEVLNALREHAVASGLLIGTYARLDGSVKLGPETSVDSGNAETSPIKLAS